MKHAVCFLAILLLVVPCSSAAQAQDVNQSQNDVDKALQNLKSAESVGDPALVKKVAAETLAMARKIETSPPPSIDADKPGWQSLVDRARAAETYTEYALLTAALTAQPATTVDLIATLEQQNPKSKYLDDAYGSYFAALRQTGGTAKIPGIAEAALVNFPDNEDVLLELANHAITVKQNDRALHYAGRLVTVMNKRTRPENMTPVAWERKRAATIGVAHYIAGTIDASRNQFVDADKELRAALPFLKDNKEYTTLLETSLFYLGVSNFQLGKLYLKKSQVEEAIKFSEQAAAMGGPLSTQATHNVWAMKAEASKMR
jgi:tetratricopeptide (TPR) repeat protein